MAIFNPLAQRKSKPKPAGYRWGKKVRIKGRVIATLSPQQWQSMTREQKEEWKRNY